MPRYQYKSDGIILLTVLLIIFMTMHTAGAASIDPEAENGEHRISMGRFVLMLAETLDAPIIQSEAEMSAMRYAYKAGWIETHERSAAVTREQAADILVIASGHVIWPQEEVPFADGSDISDNYKDAVSCAMKLGLMIGDPDGAFRPKDALTYAEAGYLMERLRKMDTSSYAQLVPEGLKELRITYLGDNAILESGTARRALTDIPQSLLKRFADCGWTLYFASDPLSAYYSEHPEAVGVTDHQKNAIYVYVDASYTYSAENTLLHEFGHFLQYISNGRYSDQIQQAYAHEKELLASLAGRQYCMKSPQEFFAEAFRTYLQGAGQENMQIYSVVRRAML